MSLRAVVGNQQQGGTGAGGVAVSAGANSYSSGTIFFSNANGVTFGLDAASNLTASIQPGAAAGIGALYDGANSITSGTARFTNANGVSFTFNGQVISASVVTNYQSQGAYLTTAMQSNAATISNINVSAGASSALVSAITFSNVNGISFGYDKTNITASYTVPTVTNSSWTVSDAATSATVGRLAFTNSNGITMTLSTSNNGNHTVIASYNSTQFAGTGTSATNASITLGSNGLAISVANPGAGGGIAVADVNGHTISNSTVVFSNSNGVSFGLSGSTMTASVLAGAGIGGISNSQTNYTSGTVIISEGGGAITIASGANQSFNISVPATSSLVGLNDISISTNGSTITVMDQFHSYWQNGPPNSLISQQATQSTSVIWPVFLPYAISCSFARIPMLFTTSSTTIAPSNQNMNASMEIYSTVNLVAYSLGTGANSQSLQYVASGQGLVTQRQSISVNQASSNSGSYTQAMTFPVSGSANSNFISNYTINVASYNFSTTGYATNFSTARYFDIPFANSLSAGAYWFCFGISTNSATNSTYLSNATKCAVTYSNHYAVSGANLAINGLLGIATNSSVNMGVGSFTTVGGGTTNSIPISCISSSASNLQPYIQLIRSA